MTKTLSFLAMLVLSFFGSIFFTDLQSVEACGLQLRGGDEDQRADIADDYRVDLVSDRSLR